MRCAQARYTRRRVPHVTDSAWASPNFVRCRVRIWTVEPLRYQPSGCPAGSVVPGSRGMRTHGPLARWYIGATPGGALGIAMSSASPSAVIGCPESLTASIWITAEPAANWTPAAFCGGSTVADTFVGVAPNVLGDHATVVAGAEPFDGATATVPAAARWTVVVIDAGACNGCGAGCVVVGWVSVDVTPAPVGAGVELLSIPIVDEPFVTFTSSTLPGELAHLLTS